MGSKPCDSGCTNKDGTPVKHGDKLPPCSNAEKGGKGGKGK
jgi:hypothetical protein